MSEWDSGDQLTVPGEMKELGGRVTPLYNNSTNYGQGYKGLFFYSVWYM